MKRGKRYDTSDVMFRVITDAKKRCKHCGHTLLLGYSEKKICYVCGNYVYRNNKIEFREQIKKRLKHWVYSVLGKQELLQSFNFI